MRSELAAMRAELADLQARRKGKCVASHWLGHTRRLRMAFCLDDADDLNDILGNLMENAARGARPGPR